MAGASVGRSLPRPCSAGKTLRRCRNNAATENVVFIDIDGDDVENVIVIDSPELFSKELRGSSVRKHKQHQQRVIICIDDEEIPDNKHPDTGLKKRCNLSSGASSSKGGPSAAADVHAKFQNEASDDIVFVQENISSPVKISKCKRTYSGKAPARGRYGLGPESEDDFSNDEVEEDSSGSVREQWEKAFSKRKNESGSGQTGGGGCSTSSKASHHTNYSGTMEEEFSGSPVEHWEQASGNSNSGNSNDQSGNRDYSVYSDDRNNDTEASAAEQLKNASAFSISGKENYERKFSSPLSSIENLSREPFSKRGKFGGHILKSVLKGPHAYNKTSTHSTIDPLVEESKINCGQSQDTKFSDHDVQVFTDKVGSLHGKIFSQNTCDINSAPNVDGHLVNETFLSNYVNEVVNLHEESGSRVRSPANCMVSEREKLKETNEYKKVMEEEWASRRRVLQAQAEEAKHLRRLRKRENAERMRLLDMERRQKQRVEEIRETNKKDEEQMNMKDLIRAEVRNELSKVEISSCDMASLLRSLGIQVGSELRPNADEVRAACKRALFTFHPDRASKSDTRQQVEAEEKFKLICRMKEKFSVA